MDSGIKEKDLKKYKHGLMPEDTWNKLIDVAKNAEPKGTIF